MLMYIFILIAEMTLFLLGDLICTCILLRTFYAATKINNHCHPIGNKNF
jgi:hypothetical protein